MTPSPSVLVVTTVHDPRDARISVRQIGALTSAGCRVTFAAPFAARGVPAPDGVRPVELPRARGRDRLPALRQARRLLRALAPQHDVVIVHDPELLLAVPWRGSTATIVWDVHEDAAAAVLERDYLPRPVRRGVAAVLRRLERLAERRLTLVLAETAYQRRFRDRHPVIRNVPVVPDDVEPPQDDRVVYVGRVSGGRGALEMIELGRRLSPVRMQVVGWADDDVSAAMLDAERDGRIDWIGQDGYVDNRAALGALDGALAGISLLHDLPNYRVSLPTKLLEYMAHGLPVVTTPLPAAVEIVERGRCGFVVPFGDVDAARDAISALAADPDLACAMGRRGHALARREYNWQHEATAFVDLVREWAA